MAGYRRLIDKINLTDNLAHKIYLTVDESKLFLIIQLEDRFKIEKTFNNNALGAIYLEKIQKTLDTEEKVLQYLGIGEKNE